MSYESVMQSNKTTLLDIVMLATKLHFLYIKNDICHPYAFIILLHVKLLQLSYFQTIFSIGYCFQLNKIGAFKHSVDSTLLKIPKFNNL